MFIFAMNNEITSDCSASPVILFKYVHFSLNQSNQINALRTALKAGAPSTINFPTFPTTYLSLFINSKLLTP